MRLRTLMAAAAVFLSTGLAAHADTFELLNLNSPISNGGTLVGTVNLDLTNGIDSTINLVYTLGGSSSLISGTAVKFQALGSVATLLEFDESTGHLLLDFQTPTAGSLAGYTGGGLCTLLNVAACGGSPSVLILPPTFQTGVDLSSGNLTPAAVPEPSSFILLGSAMLGFAGMTRRRFV
jgi:hypothetical protein